MNMDMLLPAGPQAARIAGLWDITLAICVVVFATVLVALLWALWRRPRADASVPADTAVADRPERGARRSVGAATLASVLLLVFLIVASIVTDFALARMPAADALEVEVTANQWWWEARYTDPRDANDMSRRFTTANELHIPTGRPVKLTLRSNDVIHSFWVPRLHGKKDLIPGRTASLLLQADQAGAYRGQCAEFCGLQHSAMAVLLVAEPPERYAAWAERQRQPAAEPGGSAARRGRELFLRTTCVMCHAIGGTEASARRGPDLTHLAGRTTIGAGTLPNTADALKSWIRNPQHHKPGANMPASNLSDDDLAAIVAYLQGLT